MRMTMWEGPRWVEQHHVVHAPISKPEFRAFEFGNNYLLCRSVLLAIGSRPYVYQLLHLVVFPTSRIYDNNDRFVSDSLHVRL